MRRAKQGHIWSLEQLMGRLKMTFCSKGALLCNLETKGVNVQQCPWQREQHVSKVKSKNEPGTKDQYVSGRQFIKPEQGAGRTRRRAFNAQNSYLPPRAAVCSWGVIRNHNISWTAIHFYAILCKPNGDVSAGSKKMNTFPSVPYFFFLAHLSQGSIPQRCFEYQK